MGLDQTMLSLGKKNKQGSNQGSKSRYGSRGGGGEGMGPKQESKKNISTLQVKDPQSAPEELLEILSSIFQKEGS